MKAVWISWSFDGFLFYAKELCLFIYYYYIVVLCFYTKVDINAILY